MPASHPLIKEYNSLQKKITIVKVNERLFVVNIHKKIFGLPVFSSSREFRDETEAQKFFIKLIGDKQQ